jgi:hypothetical protein
MSLHPKSIEPVPEETARIAHAAFPKATSICDYVTHSAACTRTRPSRIYDHARLASRLLSSFAGRDCLPAGLIRKVSDLFTSHPPCPGFACRITKSDPEPFFMAASVQV